MASASWRNEYTQALRDRDERERAAYARIDDSLINAFSDLLARTTALEAEKAASTQASTTSTLKPAPKSSDSGTVETPASAQVKSDLAEALRSNHTLQSRLKTTDSELSKLKMKNKSDTKLLETTTKEKNILSQKVKDRDEELRGKARLLDEVQDEVLSLNLQLNMSEQTVKKLKSENKELIDRWMAYKGREAEAMNNAL